MKKTIPQIQTLAQESQTLYDVLNNEADLACVLISVSYLDYALASLLKHFFIESSIAEKILNPPRGALSTFASRTDLAYCLGLIPKGLYQNLEKFGEIRNAFAHNYLSLTFEDSEIAALVDKLSFPTVRQSVTLKDGAFQDYPNPFSKFSHPRDRFTVIVVFMAELLLLIGLADKHREKLSEGW